MCIRDSGGAGARRRRGRLTVHVHGGGRDDGVGGVEGKEPDGALAEGQPPPADGEGRDTAAEPHKSERRTKAVWPADRLQRWSRRGRGVRGVEPEDQHLLPRTQADGEPVLAERREGAAEPATCCHGLQDDAVLLRDDGASGAKLELDDENPPRRFLWTRLANRDDRSPRKRRSRPRPLRAFLPTPFASARASR